MAGESLEPSRSTSEKNLGISEVLGLDETPRSRERMKFAAAAVLLIEIVAAVLWYSASRNRGAVQYRTAPVTRGDLTVNRGV